MNEKNSADAWNTIKKDSLFLEAVCRYLESEELLTESQMEIFKKLWFCRICQEEEKNKKFVSEKEK